MSDETDLDGSLLEALEALGDRLRRDSDREDRQALQMEVLALAGWSAPEIRARLGLSAEDMRLMVARLKRALRNIENGS